MKRYCIGDVIVDIDVECERLERLGKPYEVDVDGPPNMRVIITKEMLDDMHLRKIDMADEVFVINVGGYIGSSTRREIEYALSQGKKVNYLENK